MFLVGDAAHCVLWNIEHSCRSVDSLPLCQAPIPSAPLTRFAKLLRHHSMALGTKIIPQAIQRDPHGIDCGFDATAYRSICFDVGDCGISIGTLNLVSIFQSHLRPVNAPPSSSWSRAIQVPSSSRADCIFAECSCDLPRNSVSRFRSVITCEKMSPPFPHQTCHGRLSPQPADFHRSTWDLRHCVPARENAPMNFLQRSGRSGKVVMAFSNYACPSGHSRSKSIAYLKVSHVVVEQRWLRECVLQTPKHFFVALEPAPCSGVR